MWSRVQLPNKTTICYLTLSNNSLIEHMWLLFKQNNLIYYETKKKLVLWEQLSRKVTDHHWCLKLVESSPAHQIWLQHKASILSSPWRPLHLSRSTFSLKGTQDWEFFWLRFWILYYLIVTVVTLKYKGFEKNLLFGHYGRR